MLKIHDLYHDIFRNIKRTRRLIIMSSVYDICQNIEIFRFSGLMKSSTVNIISDVIFMDITVHNYLEIRSSLFVKIKTIVGNLSGLKIYILNVVVYQCFRVIYKHFLLKSVPD